MSTYLNIRAKIEPHLKRELEAEAKKQRRTITTLAIMAIEKGLAIVSNNTELERLKKAAKK